MEIIKFIAIIMVSAFLIYAVPRGISIIVCFFMMYNDKYSHHGNFNDFVQTVCVHENSTDTYAAQKPKFMTWWGSYYIVVYHNINIEKCSYREAQIIFDGCSMKLDFISFLRYRLWLATRSAKLISQDKKFQAKKRKEKKLQDKDFWLIERASFLEKSSRNSKPTEASWGDTVSY